MLGTLPRRDLGTLQRRDARELQLVEKEINGGNPAIPGNDEISTSVCWRLIRAARYPLDPPAIAHFLRLVDRARDSIDLVAASVDASLGIEEHAIFSEDFVSRRCADAPGRSHRRRREDCVSARSICCRTWLLFLLFGPYAACANVSGGLNLTLLADVHRRFAVLSISQRGLSSERPVRLVPHSRIGMFHSTSTFSRNFLTFSG